MHFKSILSAKCFYSFENNSCMRGIIKYHINIVNLLKPPLKNLADSVSIFLIGSVMYPFLRSEFKTYVIDITTFYSIN